MQFPPRYQLAWKNDTVEYVSEFFHAAEPDVPEEEVPVGERFDGLARITSKELAPIHSVKRGTLQNACSTRPRLVADVGKGAHMHTVRLMNSRQKGSKRMMTKSAVAMVKKRDWHESVWQPVVNRDTRHELNTRQLGCVLQDMEPPKSATCMLA